MPMFGWHTVRPHVLIAHVLCPLGPSGPPMLSKFDTYLMDRAGRQARVFVSTDVSAEG